MSVANFTNDNATATAVSILIVDDESDMRLLARTVLARAGIEVVGEAADGVEAMSKVCEFDPPPVPTVILLDNRMPGLSGLDVAVRILERTPHQLIILFSAYLDDDTVAAAKRFGVAACVSKKDVMALPNVIRTLVVSMS
jgi:CheY-like chemotaxis protein